MHNRKDNTFRGHKGFVFALDTKTITDAGEFEGYASTFENVDNGGDIAVQGCYAETLRKRPAPQIKMLWNHNSDEPIGRWVEAREDSHGLFVKGKLLLGVQRARETLELMREGAVGGLSIGYRTVKADYDLQSDTRRLLEVDLREISVVTMPMNEEAVVSLVKGNRLPSEREFEAWLHSDEVGFTKWQAKAIVADGYRAFCKAERDAGTEGNHQRHAERDAGTGDESGLLEAIRGLRRRLS